MKSNRSLLLAVLVWPVAAISAQEGWLVPFAAAYQPDVSQFNQVFAGHNLPQARERHYGWGIEVRSLVSGFLLGPMFFRTWDDVANDSFHIRTDATAILGEVGLKMTPLDFLAVVPMIGAGALTHSFSIRARTGDVNLDSLLSSPGQNAALSSGMRLAGMAALELGLSAATGGGRYGVALRAGYLYSPLTVDWRLSNGAEVTGVPNTKLGGPFFSVGLLILPATQTTSTGGFDF